MGNYSPGGRITGIEEFTQTGIDANAASTSNSFDISGALNFILQVIGNTGTHGVHIVQLQCSIDDAIWNDIPSATIAGEGVVGEVQIAAKFARIRVSTPEGAASTIDIKMQAK